MRSALFSLTVCAVLLGAFALRAQDRDAAPAPVLKPTTHQRLPAQASQLWMAPDSATVRSMRTTASTEFTTAVTLEVENNFGKALPLLQQPSVRRGTLGNYAEYY